MSSGGWADDETLVTVCTRDLRDIGAKKIAIHSLNKVWNLCCDGSVFIDMFVCVHCWVCMYVMIGLFMTHQIILLFVQFHYGKISGKRNGRVKKGIIFATYSSLIGESSSGGKYRTRFNQLMHWLGPQFEGVVSYQFYQE